MILVTKGNIVVVAIATALIGTIAQLDGAGASTFLLTIPALLPLYRELHMSRYLLLLLVALSAGIVNMIPWGGPTGRAASVIGEDPVQLWYPLIPLQFFGIALTILLAIILGIREKKRIDKRIKNGEIEAPQAVDVRSIADAFTERQREEEAATKEKNA